MIKVRNLILKYGENTVLDIKNLDIDTTKITSLTGNNGSGKSTLLRVVAFLQRPSDGSVEIWGEKAPNLKLLRQIAVLFPEPILLKRSVRENFKFALKSRALKSEFNSRVGEALELVGLDESFLNKKHYELSSGQTQRVAFALVLALRARLNLLDEPTNSVDLATSKLFGKAIRYLKDQYKSGFIIASHDEKWLSAIAQESVFLHKGKVSEFELKNVFDNSDGFLKFAKDISLALPSELKNSQKIAVNPSKIILDKKPFKDGFSGLLHSVSIVYGEAFLVKIKVGDFLIKAIVKSENLTDDKLTTGENIYFKLGQDAISSLE